MHYKRPIQMKMTMALVYPLLLLFLSALPSFISMHSFSPSYYSDQESLLAFKHSLFDDPHNSMLDWSPHHSFCNWTGIVCSSHHHQRVVSLNLTGMSLVGPISPFLGNLSFIRVLVLFNNSFEGQIPSQLGRLFRLRILHLSLNELDGSIPPTLGHCQSLQALKLSYNHLSSSIPSQLGLLSQLEIIYLGANQLTGIIPSSLGNMSSLIDLDFSENNLIGVIPIALSNCTLLQYLQLYENKLHGGIPIELGMLTQLKEVYLHKNNLIGVIPTTLSNCSLLQILWLFENKLHGGIPVEFGMLTQLGLLYLDTNNLIGAIPTTLSNCTLLQTLSLYDNQLNGHIPLQFGKLLELQHLLLWGNLLSGEIPTSLSNCTQLQRLELSINQLSGKVPLEFGNLRQLLVLRLWGNHLVSGSSDLSILTALTNCSSLIEIDLSWNDFTGILPSSVSQLSSKLSILQLHSNKIEGNIPSGISNLTMLTLLELSDNRLNGTIPSPLCRLPHLERFHMFKNNLYGSIPKSLGQAKSLGFFGLSENLLSGQIPDSIGNLTQLRYLLLDYNQLSGKIPASLGRCQTLELVDLSHNKLRGNIPPEFAGLKNLQFYFNISSNQLQGSLLEVSNMVMVQAIDVSLNSFSGEIPVVLSSCTALQYLNLSWNSFDGPIPKSLTNLKNLQEIDLSNNNLSGAIPKDFQEMKTLQHINLSSNRLTGEVPKEGVFAIIDKSAFMGNLGLCGQWINLQPCFDSKHKQILVSKKVIVPVVIGMVIFIMSIVLLVIFYRRHSNQNTLDLNIGPKRISYEELERATSGFSQTNLVGVGSFGSVYRGILNNGTNIAVKVFNLQDENSLQSFNRECNVLKRVRHRNVIKIISTCSSLDFKALVLPFMSNGSLERWLYHEGGDECRLNLCNRLVIAKDVAHGMAYLHHHCFVQVIHCDLKPNNVLLGDDMTPYIADFGITKLLFGNSIDSLTSTNALKGSTGYIAPEYGMGGEISSKGDVYSYGILLLELLTRRRPTDDMFVEGINLPKWLGMAFPNKITEVVDNNLLRDVKESELSMMLSFLTQFIQVGLACTRELPQQRPNMMNIVERLEIIMGKFLATRSFQLPIDISPLIESTSGPRNTNLGRDENWSTSSS